MWSTKVIVDGKERYFYGRSITELLANIGVFTFMPFVVRHKKTAERLQTLQQQNTTSTVLSLTH